MLNVRVLSKIPQTDITYLDSHGTDDNGVDIFFLLKYSTLTLTIYKIETLENFAYDWMPWYVQNNGSNIICAWQS